ncbi:MULTISPECIES: hypothetical protein [Buttiauxella]|jgi:hypothetical protein|uniref:Uncharacterized protein n=1 Tax=Buttiauxella agrestis TaxID=82977 RepID=A0A381KPZ4_9ENTR|nr:hypothetical protein [Buttiauxella agrestis]SUY92877.1 Uncharacterised protein [Buttiauxella agrestis]
MAKLTKAEQKWLDDMQAVLNRCPSKRLGFYTMGDYSVHVFNLAQFDEVCALMDKGKHDFHQATKATDADFYESLEFPAQVQSTAG